MDPHERRVGEVSVSALPAAVVENTSYLLMGTSSLRSTLSLQTSAKRTL
jgi:hypothetical protein